MKTFKEFSKKLNELALSEEDYSRFDVYFNDIKDNKKTLKNLNYEINNLKVKLSDISIDDIRFGPDKYRDGVNYEVLFNTDINVLFFSIRDFILKIQEVNPILYKKIIEDYFNFLELNFSYDVEIVKNNYNKFHFPIELPIPFRNIGLGKKIVIATLNKFDFLSFNSVEDSDELKYVVHSLINRSDIYSFMKDNQIIIFKDNFDLIINTLKNYYQNYNNYSLDIDFYEKYVYKIKEIDFLFNMYKNKNFYKK
jgi:hypothetical protein